MIHDYLRIKSRFYDTPLMIEPSKALVIEHVLNTHLNLNVDSKLDLEAPEMSRFVGSSVGRDGRGRMMAIADGVAVIPVLGTLVNRGAWIGTRSGLTSYEGLEAQIRSAMADPEVNSILLDIDSPGGEATGAFSLAATIREARSEKPVVAVVNDVAASAAYAIASQATSIAVSQTSMTGSIGVVLVHLDGSAKMEKEGVRPTLIYAGSHKVDGSPFSPLTDGAKAELQNRVMSFYDQFVQQVGAGRGDRFSAEAARNTQARVLMGEEAVRLGLADRVATFSQVLSELQTAPPAGKSKRKGISMSHEQNTPAAISEQDRAALRAEGAAAERTRMASILNSAEAKGRESMAIRLALEPAMSVEGATALLKEMPVTGATTNPATIEQRATQTPSFDATAPQQKPTAEVLKSSWDDAFKRTPARSR